MAQISDSAFKAHADRFAKQIEILTEAIGAVVNGGTEHYEIIAAEAPNKYEMMSALMDGYKRTDAMLSDSRALLTSAVSQTVNADSKHATEEGFANLDEFLNDSDIDVHENYGLAYSWSKGIGLDAVNVFKKTSVNLGEYAATGSGVGVFTEGTALGQGYGKHSPTNHCANQFEVVVMSGIGATDLQLKLSVVKEGPAEDEINVVIPANSLVNHVEDVGTSADRFVKLNADKSTAAGGTNGDAVIIRSKVLRTIEL